VPEGVELEVLRCAVTEVQPVGAVPDPFQGIQDRLDLRLTAGGRERDRLTRQTTEGKIDYAPTDQPSIGSGPASGNWQPWVKQADWPVALAITD
jgi:hypothetical protein